MEEKNNKNSVIEKAKTKSKSSTSYTSYTRGYGSSGYKSYYSKPVPPYFKLSGIILGILCAVGLIVSVIVIVNFTIKRNDLEQKGYVLKQENDVLKAQIEAENIAAFEDVLFKVYPNDTDLYNVVAPFFKYSMKINGTAVNVNNYASFDIKSSDLTIEISESVLQNSLPFSVMKKASLFNPKIERTMPPMKVTGTTTQYQTETVEESNKITVTYRFTNLQVGEIVSVFFNENSLVEALGLDANSFEIRHTSDK